MEVLERGIKADHINNMILRMFVKLEDTERNKNRY
jgi:hypothetical protein